MIFVSAWLDKHRKKPKKHPHPKYVTESELARVVRHAKTTTDTSLEIMGTEIEATRSSLARRVSVLEKKVAKLQEEVAALEALIS